MSFVSILHYCVVFVRMLVSEFVWNVFNLRKNCESNERLDGKVVVITGANTGIGKVTAEQLAIRGAKVIIGCRDLTKAENAVKDIKEKNPKAKITAFKLDLSSLKSVRQFSKTIAEKETKIDILINNAGVMNCPEWKTEDGFEMQFGTNHLGHFLLTLRLLPLLKKSSKARVITVAANLYIAGEINFENINLRNGSYRPLKGYAQSKLANILFTREIARRLGPNSNINTYSLHPGVFDSELSRHMPSGRKSLMERLGLVRLLFETVESGAQTTLYCALEKSLDNETGLYYDNCERVDKMLSTNATDDEIAKRLWDMSCDLVRLEDELRI